MDFIVNSKHGTDEETQIMVIEIKDLDAKNHMFFLGVLSGFINAIMGFSLVGELTEPILREFLDQRYLSYKKEGLFEE